MFYLIGLLLFISDRQVMSLMNQKFLFTTLMTVGVLLLIEGLARQIPRAEGEQQPDPETLWSQPTGTRTEHGVTVRINTNGLRGKELKTKQHQRMLSVGDSSIFGFLVEEDEVFTSVLTSGLQRNGIAVDHVNGASPGHSSLQSLKRLAWLLPQADPDLLIIGNLWSDSALAGFEDIKLYERQRNSYLSRLALFRLLETLLRGEDARILRWHARPTQSSSGPPRVSIPLYKQNLEAMLKLSAEHSCKVVLLGLYLEEELSGKPEEMAEQYRHAMRSVAAAHQVPYWSARDAWQDEEDLFADFLHPNAKGHRLLGSYFIEEAGLLLQQ